MNNPTPNIDKNKTKDTIIDADTNKYKIKTHNSQAREGCDILEKSSKPRQH